MVVLSGLSSLLMINASVSWRCSKTSTTESYLSGSSSKHHSTKIQSDKEEEQNIIEATQYLNTYHDRLLRLLQMISCRHRQQTLILPKTPPQLLATTIGGLPIHYKLDGWPTYACSFHIRLSHSCPTQLHVHAEIQCKAISCSCWYLLTVTPQWSPMA